MHVLVAGCGWLGTAAARALAGRGDRVTALTRTLPHAVRLMEEGIPCLARDLASDGGTSDLPSDVDAVLATQAAAGGGVAAYRAAYLDATAGLLGYAARVGVSRFVYTSSTGVFGQRDGGIVDEATPVAPADPTATILVEAERLVLAAADARLSACVVRPSGLYGKGRTGIIERVKSGALALGTGDDQWMNFCHQADAVTILLAALDRGFPGAIYHASDLEPALRGDVVLWIAKRLKMTPPRSDVGDGAGGRRGANRRISSAASRDALGVRLAFPNYRRGMAPFTVDLRS
jgi:nucleoside-diphosphate-sugar epimerase